MEEGDCAFKVLNFKWTLSYSFSSLHLLHVLFGFMFLVCVGFCVGHVVEKSSRKSLFDGNRFSAVRISSL